MKHYHLNTISSTNDYAKELLENEPFVVVTADYQTEGRGRKNKNWQGDFGDNVYLSVGINHKEIRVKSNLVIYQAIGCLAVKKTIEDLTGLKSAKIKYPNDLMIKVGNEWKKICGVLAEHSFIGNQCQNTVIGIGVNVRQQKYADNIKDTAISLMDLGYDVTTDNVLPKLIDDLEYYLNKTSKELMAIWKSELNIEGKSVKIIGESGNYFVKQVKSDGQLDVVDTRTGEVRNINNGDSIRYDID